MKRLLTLRWILTTLLVLLAVGAMIRLGIWQLDRLAQRQAFNARVSAQISAPELDLNNLSAGADLVEMEYRPVKARGQYDFSQQVLLRNQSWENLAGYHLLTPLLIEGSDQAVLVNRGWIPLDEADDLSVYDEPGIVTVTGMLRRSRSKPPLVGLADPTLAPGQTRLDAFNWTDIDRIQTQTEADLLPIWIQQAEVPGRTQPPYPKIETVELTEGSHLSYALQWFAFAAMLGIGYPFFVRRRLRGGWEPPEGKPRERRVDGGEQHAKVE